MTDKELYRIVCTKEPTIPIFSRDWWMDAVCGEEYWDVILIKKGGYVIAALPYYFKMKINGIIISQPTLTQKNGIWLKYPEYQKLSTKYKYEKKTIKDIIQQMDKLNIIRYNQNFDYAFANWLPFYWNGFKQCTGYTYVLQGLDDLENIYNNFDSNLRRNIKNAGELVEVKEDLSIEVFYKINEMTFKRQNKKIPYSLEFIKRLDGACSEHNCRKNFYAVDKEGRIHSAVYIVWDENSAYYIMSSGDPELRRSEATSLLVWEAIKFSGHVTKKFDFEGSMVEHIERFFAAFSAEQKQYFEISKDFKKKSIFHIVAKYMYDYYPWAKKAYNRLRGE